MTLNSKFEETDSTLPTSLLVFTTNETTRQYCTILNNNFFALKIINDAYKGILVTPSNLLILGSWPRKAGHSR